MRLAVNLLALLFTTALAAIADPVNVVNPATLSENENITFGGVASGYWNGVLTVDDDALAERFVGQTLTYSGNFDVLGTTASGPLTLQTGALDQNLYVFHGSPTGVLGCGLRGCELINPPAVAIIGEGSIAVLFGNNQKDLTLNLIAGGAGQMTFDFFRGDGYLIGQSVIAVTAGGQQTYGFSRNGGLADIAGFSVQNNIPNGIGIVDLGDTTPEPATWICLSSGLLFVFFRKRPLPTGSPAPRRECPAGSGTGRRVCAS